MAKSTGRGKEAARTSEFPRRGSNRSLAEDKKAEDDEMPFACYICRKDFKNPVVTACNHYFCGKCIMTYKGGPEGKGSPTKCPVCGKQTFGVYNTATKLLKRIAERKSKEQNLR